MRHDEIVQGDMLDQIVQGLKAIGVNNAEKYATKLVAEEYTTWEDVRSDFTNNKGKVDRIVEKLDMKEKSANAFKDHFLNADATTVAPVAPAADVAADVTTVVLPGNTAVEEKQEAVSDNASEAPAATVTVTGIAVVAVTGSAVVAVAYEAFCADDANALVDGLLKVGEKVPVLGVAVTAMRGIFIVIQEVRVNKEAAMQLGQVRSSLMCAVPERALATTPTSPPYVNSRTRTTTHTK
jgi:hypothetical protein